MKNPLVSVIMPVYNGEKFLCQAMDSVVGQDYKNTEIIIVDDGSTDKTAELVKPYLKRANVSYVFQTNGGQAAALNKGVSIANGEFLSFVDYDDLWDSKKLQIQLKAFAEDPDLDVVFGHLKNFAEDKVADRLVFNKELIPGYAAGSMCIKTSSFFKVGFFNSESKKGYFWPWYDSLELRGMKKQLLPELLYHRRVHGANISICSDSKDYKGYFLAIRAVRKQRENEN
jgi:glycosyltransferase involved in cell wall biosynthesis